MESVKKVSLDDLLNGTLVVDTTDTDSEFEVWDNQPGGHVVKRFQQDGVKYVLVEFNNSPGEFYQYLQGSK